MMSKIDLHLYQSVKEFLTDIGLICSNALEYNPDKDPAGMPIRKHTVHAFYISKFVLKT